MQRVRRMILAIGLLLAIFAAIGSYTLVPHNPQTVVTKESATYLLANENPLDVPEGASSPVPPIEKVTGYKRWTLVNPEPEIVRQPIRTG